MLRNILVALSIVFTGYAASAAAAEHEVKMLNMGAGGAADIMAFEPAYLKVEPGDTVNFVATDIGHDSVSFFSPEGGTEWKGDNSKDISVTFDTEGVYLYNCTPHAVMAMVGVIQVGEAVNLEAATESAKEFAKQFTLNADRFDKYLAEVK